MVTGRAFGRLYRLPGPGSGRGVRLRFAAEHVGVAADHLVGDRSRDVGEVEGAGLAAHLRVEDDLEQQVAELVDESRHVAAADGVEHLIGFLDGVGSDGLEGLLAVPRASAFRVAQAGHDGEEAIDVGHE